MILNPQHLLQNCNPKLLFLKRTLKQKTSGGTISKLTNKLFAPKGVGPPFKHIVQIGDPVLRLQCDKVKPEEISSSKIQKIIENMLFALGRFDSIGLSAPQIGIPLQIMAIQFTKSQLNGWSEELIKERSMEEIPLKIFINPTLKVVDNQQIHLQEGCCSLHGFSALVPRSKAVILEGLDRDGNAIKWKAEDWAARIAQHEYDHLQGTIFTDVMVRESFCMDYWRVVNSRKGGFSLSYSGIKGPSKWLFPMWAFKQKK